MNYSTALKVFCLLFCLLVTLAAVSTAPVYSSDYDNNINDMMDMLMQKDQADDVRIRPLIDDGLGMHQVVRKSRGPQLRLRFGKRYDHPYLRLRFGKREDGPVPLSAYMAGMSTDGEN